ncbi:MAG: hypothetical protein ACRCTJ_02470 [Brevinema sp.]
MAIIDDIYHIESTISEIKNNAEVEIIKLKEQEKEKERAIKEQFEQEFINFKAEKDLIVEERMKVFCQDLFSDLDSVYDSLHQKFEAHKEAIIKIAVNEFWQE